MSGAPEVIVDALGYRYAGSQSDALTDLSCTFPAAQVTTVLGPSGSGKSTLLALLAGTAFPTTGTVSIGERDASGDTPAERGVALVLQRPYLFPYLSVVDNVAFGLAARGVGRVERRERASEWLARVGLSGVERRRPTQLSGGQQQRVALARALATTPRVLLLDEPFANLDPSLRREMAEQLGELVRRTDVTTIMVTHDLSEAMAIGHTTVVLRDGRLVGAGLSRQMYAAPPTRAAAELMGISLFLDGLVRDGSLIPAPGVALGVPDTVTDTPHASFALRPEHVWTVDACGPNVLEGVVARATFRGEYWQLVVTTAVGALDVRASRANVVGESCLVQLPADCLITLSAETTDVDVTGPAAVAGKPHM